MKKETSSHRLALDGLSEELAGGDEDGADDEHGDGPFVVQLEGQVVDGDLAHTKEDLSRSLYTGRGGGGSDALWPSLLCLNLVIYMAVLDFEVTKSVVEKGVSNGALTAEPNLGDSKGT